MKLDDGRRIGLSVGGRGVPLLFMHGLLLSRKAYLRMLSRMAGMGFLVVAVDAAGHGDTGRLPGNACGFSDRADDHEAWERELLDTDALVLEFIHGRERVEIGADELDHVDLELVRRSERAQERMSWARRTYRRWAAANTCVRHDR